MPSGAGHGESSQSATQSAEFTSRPKWGRLFNSDYKAESPWARKVVLTLDGGGIRGYASLLMLKRLVQRIEDIETGEADYEKHDGSATYSWGMPMVNQEHSFKLHHYVDYFVGTSTGGLSAMMLGRLQMTVAQALDKYDRVGNEVFGQPRLLTLNGILRPRFKSRYMERALMASTVPDPSTTLSKSAERLYVKTKADEYRLRNPNPSSARTVVVAFGVSGKGDRYLFRSYDHPLPNFHAAGNLRYLHLNPGPASDKALWKIGRATSAAPTYFSPMKIGGDLYKDGAMGHANNPVNVAYEEVKQMHSSHEPSMIISVGTGIKESREETRGAGGGAFLPNLRDTYDSVKSFQKQVLKSEQVHQEFEHRITRGNVPEDRRTKYFRFNVPANDGIGDIKLGEWEGPDGAVTKRAMERAVERYLDTIKPTIRACAEELVKIRRRREKTVRWERFALDSLYYVCPSETALPECEGLVFDSRAGLRKHAVQFHGFVWQVKCVCREDDELQLGEFACFWDHCEGQVSSFRTRAGFVQHLQREHGITDPKIRDREGLETWLDLGRRQSGKNDRVFTIRHTGGD